MPGGVYKRRTSEKSDLYKIAYQHFEEYEKIYLERYEEEYGYFRKIITSTIGKYLDCGIMENGFARVRRPRQEEEIGIGGSTAAENHRRCPCWADMLKVLGTVDLPGL